MANICPKCRSNIRQGNRFCTKCGANLQVIQKKQLRLIKLNQNEEALTYFLDKDLTTIGRGASNQVVIKDDQVSKHHAVIYFEDGIHWIEDLSSKNGVYLNGKRISRRERIGNGVLVKLGSTILRFEKN